MFNKPSKHRYNGDGRKEQGTNGDDPWNQIGNCNGSPTNMANFGKSIFSSIEAFQSDSYREAFVN